MWCDHYYIVFVADFLHLSDGCSIPFVKYYDRLTAAVVVIRTRVFSTTRRVQGAPRNRHLNYIYRLLLRRSDQILIPPVFPRLPVIF